jgi:hypothetical protein
MMVERSRRYVVVLGEDEARGEIGDVEGIADTLFIRSSVIPTAHQLSLSRSTIPSADTALCSFPEMHILGLNFHKICSIHEAFKRYSSVLLFLSTEEQSSREER